MKLNGKEREEDGQYVKVLQAKRIYKDTVALASVTGHQLQLISMTPFTFSPFILYLSCP